MKSNTKKIITLVLLLTVILTLTWFYIKSSLTENKTKQIHTINLWWWWR